MSWEDAMAYAAGVIDRECADQGIPVEIADPELLALSVHLMRIGKRNNDALGLEVAPAPTGR